MELLRRPTAYGSTNYGTPVLHRPDRRGCAARRGRPVGTGFLSPNDPCSRGRRPLPRGMVPSSALRQPLPRPLGDDGAGGGARFVPFCRRPHGDRLRGAAAKPVPAGSGGGGGPGVVFALLFGPPRGAFDR